MTSSATAGRIDGVPFSAAHRDNAPIVARLQRGDIAGALECLKALTGREYGTPSAQEAERSVTIARALSHLPTESWPAKLPFRRNGLLISKSAIDDLLVGCLTGDVGERVLARAQGEEGEIHAAEAGDVRNWIARCRDILRAPGAYRTLPQFRARRLAPRKLFVPLSPEAYGGFLGRFRGSRHLDGFSIAVAHHDPSMMSPAQLYLAHAVRLSSGTDAWSLTCLVRLGIKRSEEYVEAAARRLAPRVGLEPGLFPSGMRITFLKDAVHLPVDQGLINSAPRGSIDRVLGPDRCRHVRARWMTHGSDPSGFHLACPECFRRAIAFVPFHRAPDRLLGTLDDRIRASLESPLYVARERFQRVLAGRTWFSAWSFDDLRAEEGEIDIERLGSVRARGPGLALDDALARRRRSLTAIGDRKAGTTVFRP